MYNAYSTKGDQEMLKETEELKKIVAEELKKITASENKSIKELFDKAPEDKKE